MKKILFLLLFGLCIFTQNSFTQETEQGCLAEREFDIDALIENADVPEEMPVARDLPWYLDAIQQPATRMLLFVCSVWDWFKVKTDRVLHFNHKVEEIDREDCVTET